VATLFLSWPLSGETPGYGGSVDLEISPVNSIADGKTSNTKRYEMSNHIGTHIDAPNHFFENGKTIDSYPAEFWIFNKPFVLEVPCETGRWIEWKDGFDSVPRKTDLLLVKSGYCQRRNEKIYWENNPGLAPEVGEKLRKDMPSIRAVAMDFISVSRWQDRETGRKSHRTFLDSEGNGKPILLIEDADMRNIDGSIPVRRVTALPLIATGADGSPCTIVAEI
jgi:kynurenine formamidase